MKKTSLSILGILILAATFLPIRSWAGTCAFFNCGGTCDKVGYTCGYLYVIGCGCEPPIQEEEQLRLNNYYGQPVKIGTDPTGQHEVVVNAQGQIIDFLN